MRPGRALRQRHEGARGRRVDRRRVRRELRLRGAGADTVAGRRGEPEPEPGRRVRGRRRRLLPGGHGQHLDHVRPRGAARRGRLLAPGFLRPDPRRVRDPRHLHGPAGRRRGDVRRRRHAGRPRGYCGLQWSGALRGRRLLPGPARAVPRARPSRRARRVRERLRLRRERVRDLEPRRALSRRRGVRGQGPGPQDGRGRRRPRAVQRRGADGRQPAPVPRVLEQRPLPDGRDGLSRLRARRSDVRLRRARLVAQGLQFDPDARRGPRRVGHRLARRRPRGERRLRAPREQRGRRRVGHGGVAPPAERAVRQEDDLRRRRPRRPKRLPREQDLGRGRRRRVPVPESAALPVALAARDGPGVRGRDGRGPRVARRAPQHLSFHRQEHDPELLDVEPGAAVREQRRDGVPDGRARRPDLLREVRRRRRDGRRDPHGPRGVIDGRPQRPEPRQAPPPVR
mmetsp:Transcript_15119/g.46699  ORF Transcript_15119/g.46699 Transcript_15119/m.46699 type:complete len:455 (+) Transcript_15119:4058-5422(+)